MGRVLASLLALLFCTGSATAQYVAIPPTDLSYPKQTDLSYGSAYGRVGFSIEQLELPAQKYWIGELLKKVFGIRDSGEYILALELIDPNATGGDKLVARKIVAHFVKNPDGTLITDLLPFLKSSPGSNTKVEDASYIVFSGDLSSRLPINSSTNNYSVVMELYKSSSATLTNSNLISNAIDIINTSASVIKFSPISEAEKKIYDQLRTFGFNIYESFAKSSKLVASETKMSFIAVNASPAPNVIHFVFPFWFDRPLGEQICSRPDNCFPNMVDVKVFFETYPSAVANFKNGKFVAPLNWSQWLLQSTVAGQTVPQYLLSSDAKAFFTALNAGPAALRKFAADTPVDVGCTSLVNALGQGQYFSAPDVGALYWSVLNEYWTTLTSVPAGERCQTLYAGIYFDPYGLPQVSKAKSLASTEPLSKLPTTLSGAMDALSSTQQSSPYLKEFQGIAVSSE